MPPASAVTVAVERDPWFQKVAPLVT